MRCIVARHPRYRHWVAVSASDHLPVKPEITARLVESVELTARVRYGLDPLDDFEWFVMTGLSLHDINASLERLTTLDGPIAVPVPPVG